MIRRPNAANVGSRKSANALSPSASTTLIGVPFAHGGVAGSVSAITAPRSAASAPDAKIHGVTSKSAMPKQVAPTTEKTPEATQPSEPNTRIRGNASRDEWAIAMADDTDHVGM